LQRVLEAIADGSLPITVHHVYDGLEEVRQAHKDMENNVAAGKLVVRVRH
jgi:NADPH:quinone reductase-like Zn-dependent oxidoreductase